MNAAFLHVFIVYKKLNKTIKKIKKTGIDLYII